MVVSELNGKELAAVLSESIYRMFLVRTYLEAQGLQFLANDITKANAFLMRQRDDALYGDADVQ